MRYFTVQRSLRVNVSAQKSPLTSLDFATLRIKDAVCDRFRETVGSRPNIDRANPDVRVHAFLESARGAFYLDTSGEPLFKRGWRASAGEAPLRENLAAGIVLLSGWKPEEPLLDPMCGGGTLLVEAAAMARGRAPGAKRIFGFEKLKNFDSKSWNKIKHEDRTTKTVKLEIFGSDNDPRVLGDARRNIAAAGVDRWVKLEQADILERPAPAPSGVMIANPPYGERIGSREELAEFYPKLGSALKKNYPGWRCHFFTADMRLPKLMRLQPSRRVPLYNGALECRLFEYKMVEGGMRKKKTDG
jgi:putative N6-adenine-specific DNA methylase